MAKPKARPKAGAAKEDGAGSAKKRRLERRDTEAQVARLLQQNLGSLTEMQLTQNVVDGMSLLDRLTADKRGTKSGGKHLGPSYWRALKEQYGVDGVPSELKVKNDKEEADPQLVVALLNARHPSAAVRTKVLRMSYFETTPSINQKTCVGLVKFCLGLKPAANDTSAAVLLAFMKMVRRLGIRQEREEELAAGGSLASVAAGAEEEWPNL